MLSLNPAIWLIWLRWKSVPAAKKWSDWSSSIRAVLYPVSPLSKCAVGGLYCACTFIAFLQCRIFAINDDRISFFSGKVYSSQHHFLVTLQSFLRPCSSQSPPLPPSSVPPSLPPSLLLTFFHGDGRFLLAQPEQNEEEDKGDEDFKGQHPLQGHTQGKGIYAIVQPRACRRSIAVTISLHKSPLWMYYCDYTTVLPTCLYI